MPHMIQTLLIVERIGMEILLVGKTWSNLLEEVNELDNDLGYTPISMSNFNLLHCQHFKYYVINSYGNNFYHCGTYASFKDLL